MTDSLGAQKIRRAALILIPAIAAFNLSAAKEVWEASREEYDSVEDAFADESAKLLIISHSNSHFEG
ncbi:hypothetical protein ACUY2X_00880 [Corynebacterium minutissimum]